MRYEQLNNFINTNNRKRLQLQLFFIFSVFCLAQLNSFTHQLQHIDNVDEKQCLLCLSNPDVTTDPSNNLVYSFPINNVFFDFNLTKSIKFHPTRFYSTRAPPQNT